jgi:hypothetical protein
VGQFVREKWNLASCYTDRLQRCERYEDMKVQGAEVGQRGLPSQHWRYLDLSLRAATEMGGKVGGKVEGKMHVEWVGG